MSNEVVKIDQDYLMHIPATKEEWLEGIEYQIQRLHFIMNQDREVSHLLLDYLHQYIKHEWAKDD